MNNKVILPIGKPLVNFLPETDIILSIASAYESLSQSSIAENYIGIRYNTDFSENRFVSFIGDHSEWYRYKFLSVNTVSHEDIDFCNINNFISEMLNSQKYLFCNINTKYIKNYYNYGNRDFRHSIFIFGIENDTLHIADYFDYINYQYGICSINEFKNALEDYKNALYLGRNDFLPQTKDHLNGLLLFRVNQKPEKFDITKMCIELKNLINPVKTKIPSKMSYGIDVFLDISRDIKENNLKNENFITLFHFIYVHIALMEYRIKYLITNEYLFEKCLLDEIYLLKNRALALRNYVLKGALKSEYISNDREIITMRLLALYTLYKELIEKVLTSILVYD